LTKCHITSCMVWNVVCIWADLTGLNASFNVDCKNVRKLSLSYLLSRAQFLVLQRDARSMGTKLSTLY